MLLRFFVTSLLLLAALPAAAQAAPPANDPVDGPGEFTTFFAPNGMPRERAALAELAEATPDAGVPSCLGSGSFARTVWYRVPSAPSAREITVEATGRTTDIVDLAAFVQPGSGSNTTEPNACSGEGAGGSEATEDRTSAISLRVPGGQSLLVQVGRRGAVGSAEDEQAVLSLATSDLPAVARPAGDSAEGAPAASEAPVPLGGATITEEDPAQPACPARGSVWRDLGPAAGSTADVTVEGEAVGTLTLFQGARPNGENAVTCVNRERGGSLRLTAVPVTPGGRLWVRLGTERPAADATARLLIPASTATPASNGAGTTPIGAPGTPGAIPTIRGTSCVTRTQGRTRATRTRVALALSGRRQTTRQRNRFRSFPLTVQVFRGPACAVRLDLVGPRGRVYARGTVSRLSGRRALRLRRVRRIVPGTYRLRVSARAASGRRVRLITSSTPRLRIR